ncbi:DUF3572 domain-containing protein [Fulvimarina sp. 2208YS6-2-32]|uniref:DUF3572 domain-containing protein n=1 Tax=Fulvimarina uroteuthidis TaxID=3098149 RepID=A0ABU5I2B8_9HYPH|nr:DUF3572 domain-containing protein [Fulvimarina sp. 2208YS6-2-32]MDY8109517.1 DUF3572 domain-containing protein [Fulvimarina sp. 2208YS6-2-32]
MVVSDRSPAFDPAAIAIEALTYIASDERLFERFCAITGLSAEDVRKAASEPGFLAGVLEFVTAHEPTLMAFSQACGHAPETIAAAQRALPGGQPQEWYGA